MVHGWTGKTLRINLTKEGPSIESLQPHYSQFLGGKGINVKVLWDEVMPETKPLDPENRLIFGTGPLTGTLAPTSCKCSVTTKSPQTGLCVDSSIGGFWPAELKFAGYDQLILQGRAKEPSYIFINDADIQIRDARHLWGMDVLETTRCLTKELQKETGDPDIQVICIGVSGENQVASAGIMSSLSTSASRGGVGAVMGSKNLKAIAVRGTRDLAVADPEGLMQLCRTLLDRAAMLKRHVAEEIDREGECITRMSTFGNYEEVPSGPLGGQKDLPVKVGKISKEFNEAYGRQFACFNCPVACRFRIEIPGQEVSAMHCEGWFNPVFKAKSLDLKAIAQLMVDCQKLGLDYFAVTAHTAFLMDLQEKGIISEQDTDGVPMRWGDAGAMSLLARKIARKEGCGHWFAEGIVNAAKNIGRGAENHVIHTKGMEVPSYSLYPPIVGLAAAINERGDSLGSMAQSMAIYYYYMRSEEESKAVGAYFPPKITKLLDEVRSDMSNVNKIARAVEYFERMNSLSDILGVCRWAVQFLAYGIMPPSVLASLVSCVTGERMDEKTLKAANQRVSALIRAFNIREGLRRENDSLPDRTFNEISRRYGVAVNRDILEGSITGYYSLRGWDETGFPQKDTLEELGLGYVFEDLQSRTGHYA